MSIYVYIGDDDANKDLRDLGYNALNSLKEAKECLEGAKGWGVVDMLGGGLFSSMIKRSKIDEAKSKIMIAQRDLTTFYRALDNFEDTNVELNYDEFTGFVDIVFDNFLMDVMVQKRISDALNRIEELIGSTEKIINRL
ncbi:MAG: hypothetical protein Q4B60_07430 [Erysipelotrichaceae bacterium]|nr:hypothetical protein [Erysipelotrichaceae bacterium]